MFLFWRRKNLKSGLKYSSPKEQFLRIVLVLFFAGVACWAFWANSERYVTKFNASARISDETGTLDREAEKRIHALLIRADKEYGIRIHIKARKVPVLATEAPANSIFFGVCPNLRQSVIIMPPDWSRALGDGFVFRLRSENLQQYVDSGNWGLGVAEALEKLLDRFAEMTANPPAPAE
ncbi:hypothetical protein LJC36_04735 [Desulfovibrio sp. OttesenSCG-928-C14]|nr:hypothetical protein [Desulfovibrio sp. OttesenSCG-928-C14]